MNSSNRLNTHGLDTILLPAFHRTMPAILSIQWQIMANIPIFWEMKEICDYS